MRRISERTVELDCAEMHARDTFEALLDDGFDIERAAELTEMRHRDLSDEFRMYLRS